MMMVSKGQERWGMRFHCSSRSVGTADVAREVHDIKATDLHGSYL